MLSEGHFRPMAEMHEVDPGGLEAGFSSAQRQILPAVQRRGSRSLSDLARELRILKGTTREEGGYMGELGHAGKNVVEMLEHNCPIMAVAETYPEACGVEREMFQSLIRADVETSHRVVAGDPVCRFLIRARGDSKA